MKTIYTMLAGVFMLASVPAFADVPQCPDHPINASEMSACHKERVTAIFGDDYTGKYGSFWVTHVNGTVVAIPSKEIQQAGSEKKAIAMVEQAIHDEVVKQLNDEIAALQEDYEGQIDDLQVTLASNTSEILKLKSDIVEKQARITALEGIRSNLLHTIDERDDEILGFKNTIDSLNSEISDLNAAVSAKEAQVAALQKLIDDAVFDASSSTATQHILKVSLGTDKTIEIKVDFDPTETAVKVYDEDAIITEWSGSIDSLDDGVYKDSSDNTYFIVKDGAYVVWDDGGEGYAVYQTFSKVEALEEAAKAGLGDWTYSEDARLININGDIYIQNDEDELIAYNVGNNNPISLITYGGVANQTNVDAAKADKVAWKPPVDNKITHIGVTINGVTHFFWNGGDETKRGLIYDIMHHNDYKAIKNIVRELIVDAYMTGYSLGYDAGYQDGYNDGFVEGYKEGFKDGVKSVK